MAIQKKVWNLLPAQESALGFSQAVKVGEVLYISGTIAVDDRFEVIGRGDMAQQIEQVYANIRRTLAAFGADLSNVVQETFYVTDIEAFAAVADVRARQFVDGKPPAATGVEVARLFLPDLLVEISSVAHLA